MTERQMDTVDYDDEVDELDALTSDRMADPSYRAAFEDAGHRAALLLRLIDHRKTSALSQKQVAERMGTTQSAVSDIEGGISDPRLSTMFRYARAVDLRLRLRLTGHSDHENVCVVFGRADESPTSSPAAAMRQVAADKWTRREAACGA